LDSEEAVAEAELSAWPRLKVESNTGSVRIHTNLFIQSPIIQPPRISLVEIHHGIFQHNFTLFTARGTMQFRF
jgi:hypothetical protein